MKPNLGAKSACWRILAWAHRNHDSVAAADAAQRVADIARAFPRHEGIQHESAAAWANVAWAYMSHNPDATADAARRVADIARVFPRHEGILEVCAVAWLHTVDAATLANDADLIDRSLNALDALAGLDRQGRMS